MSDTNYRSGNVHESKVFTPNEQGRRLKAIFVPVADKIAKAREATDGIVVVIHNPGALAKKAMKKLGVKLQRHAATTVVGLRCSDAVAALGHDPVTSRWCAAAPKDDQVKIFLVAGDGTALLTLNFTGKGVRVEQEPDLHSV
jgi:hypothetical protein